MQIDLSSLSLEQWLLILLLGYAFSFMLLGLVEGRKYFKSYPSVKARSDSFTVKLTLAGLAMTSLAIFLGLGLSSLERVSSIILFLSISFVAFVVSSDFIRFPKGVYIYIADVLESTGILAIGCGYLVFFEKELPSSYGLLFTYGFFIIIFVLLSCVDFYNYYRYLPLFEEKEKGK